jgi:hypothetical protein
MSAPFHLTRSLATLLGVIALAPATTGFAGCGHKSSVGRDAYVAANHRLFSQLPKFPGAQSLRDVTTAYRQDDSGPVVGYSTRFEFALPSQANAHDLRAFFSRWLRSRWRLVENLQGHVLNFRRGDAFVSINLSNIRRHRLEVAVDHAWYANAGR